jgi:phosphatidylglycerol:prolipoprotein diacylglycerol transferase
MHPILFHLGSVPIYTYGVLVAAGFVVGLFYARFQACKVGLDPDLIWNFAIYGILVALVSSKLWLLASEWDYYAANPGQIFSIATLQSAGTFYGGVVGGIVWTFVYTRVTRLPLLGVLDVCAAPIAFGHGIGRIGCFVAGCCYGKPTSLPWGVTFTSPIASRIAGTPLNVSLHPTQLYEAAAEFVNFLLLVCLGTRQKCSGQLIGAFFMLYGIERGTIEFLRGDPGRTMMLHDKISLMQIVSVVLIIAGALLWRHGLRSEVAEPSAATGRPVAKSVQP